MLVRIQTLLLAAAFAPFAPPNDDPPKPPKPCVTIHEWGTFTGLSGSDGTVLVGLTHDDEALPKFVYHRLALPRGFEGVQVKMETPVLYVYSDVARELTVKVSFPKESLTQWYPQVRRLSPAVGAAESGIGGGALDWGTVAVLAPGQGLDKLHAVSAEDPWRFARETDANLLRVCGALEGQSHEHERFLFYRGIGSFALPIATRVEADGRLRIENVGTESLDGTILLHVTKDGISLKEVAPLARGEVHSISLDIPFATVTDALELVAARLEKAGLYRKEALAIVKTWQRSYFETPGLRILYLVPSSLTDAVLPLTLEPAPGALVRVLVGRQDVLLPADEARAERTVRRAASMEEARGELGRFAEPIVRRMRDTATDPSLRGAAERLLAGP